MPNEFKEASTSPLQTQRVLSDFERSAMKDLFKGLAFVPLN